MAAAKREPFTLTDQGKIKTFIRKGATLEGSLEFSSPMLIDGVFEGDIRTSSSIVIGKNSTVRANILAQSVQVYGEVVGNIEATAQLEMMENGKVIGNVRTEKLAIADGVTFDGHCEMIYPDQ